MDLGYLSNPRFWATVPPHIAMTAVVFAVGWGIKRDIARGSDLRRTHGEFVFWWTVGGYFVGWFFGPAAGADSDGGVQGFANFCMLGGWLAGTSHGALVLAWRHYRRRSSVGVPTGPGAPRDS